MSTAGPPNRDVEKGSYHHHDDHSQSRSNHTVQLTPEQYDRLFLQPKLTNVNTPRFGNPTPLAIISHLIVLTPTACYLMGWGGSSAASLQSLVGAYYMVGGMGLILAGVGEWILGNTFPSVVFVTFGGFWLSLGTLQDPMHAIPATSVDYNAGLMFYFAFWAVTCLVYMITALRTNAVFVWIFFTLIGTFVFLSAAYSKIAAADTDLATTLLKVSGSFAWACIVGAWYLIVSLLFASVDMPFVLPVGDLGRFWKKKTAKAD